MLRTARLVTGSVIGLLCLIILLFDVFSGHFRTLRCFFDRPFCFLLHEALRDRREDEVVILLRRGVSPNARSKQGHRVLGRVVLHCSSDLVQRLIDRGADVNAVNSIGSTPLHMAVARRRQDVIELLLARGADINVAGPGASAAVDIAVSRGDKEMVRYLVGKGAVIGLHAAVARGDRDRVDALLSAGADPNAIARWDCIKQAPLGLAARLGRAQIVHLLVRRGADIAATDDGGETALHKAARSGHNVAVALLLRNGADPNVQDRGNCTPLHECVHAGRLEAARLLIGAGADVNLLDGGGRAALDYAEGHRSTALAALLRKHGARRGKDLAKEKQRADKGAPGSR